MLERTFRSGIPQRAEARRRIAPAVAGLIACVALSLSCRSADESAPTPDAPSSQTRPHVVLITIDTLRADRLSSYGGDVDTPHLDRLAREGMLFEQAASTVPFTLPAHSSIMTGTYPPTHGVRENVGYRLGESRPTLAEILADEGYASAGFVSAFVLDRRWGIARGFEHYHDRFDLREMGANLGSVQRDGEETIAATSQWLDEHFAAASADPKPVFLWLHLFDPHDPYEPKEPWRSQYPGRPYDAEIAYTDSLIGEFLEDLERLGMYDETLLIVTGDHGEGLGQHDEAFHGYFIYDSTIRVPLIIRLPAQAEDDDLSDVPSDGRRIRQAVSHVDLAPTILDFLDIAAPVGAMQGRSLKALLQGAEGDSRGVYSESLYPLLHYGFAPVRSLRKDGYKYIDAPKPELFNLLEDPDETTNLYQDKRRTAAEMRQELEALRGAIEEEQAPEEEIDLDEETLAQLRALGYMAGAGGVSAGEEDAVERADPKDKIQLHQGIMAAQTALGDDQEERAERLLRQVLSRDSGMIDAHQMLGQIATRREDWPEAAERYRRALEIDAEHQASLFGLAQAYRRMERFEEALIGFERLLELNPHDSKSVLAAAQIHIDADRPAKARVLLERAVALPNPPAPLYNQIGEVLVLEGRPLEAEEQFLRAIAERDRLAQPRFNLAVLREEAGRLDEARTLYEEAIARVPNHYQAQFNLGALLGKLGDPAGRRELWEASIRSNERFVQGRYYLAKLLMDSGEDLARAEELTRQGLKLDPDGDEGGPLGYYLLADLLNRRGAAREAQEAVRRGRAIQYGD